MKIFITGGTGFLGKKLIKRLVSDGHEVWGLARSEKGILSLKEQQAHAVLGSLEDIPAWSQALRGMDVTVLPLLKYGESGILFTR